MKKIFFLCVWLLCSLSGCTLRAVITPEEISIGIGIEASEFENETMTEPQ